MWLRGRGSRGLISLLAVALSALVPPLRGSVRAAAPTVTISATGVKVQVSSAPLSETIDALSRAAGFKVTYEGARPTAMLFNAEIDTPTVAETLFRLLDGQNLNYGVVFDLTGRKVTSLMLLGPASKTGGASASSSSAPSPRPFTPPRNPRIDIPPADDEPAADAEDSESQAVNPEATPSVSPLPSGTPGPPGPGATRTVLPPSPFAPRQLVISPFAPRPTPSPSP